MKAPEKYRLKRQGILAAAEELFLKFGYLRTTMDAIADEAKATKQTVYRYFPSKADLFAALIAEMGQDDFEFQFGDGAFGDELSRFGEVFLSRHMRPRNLAFYRLMLTESRESSELRDIFTNHARSRWAGKLRSFIENRRPNVAAEGLEQLFISMLLAERGRILMGARTPLSESEIQRHVALVVRIFIGGIEA